MDIAGRSCHEALLRKFLKNRIGRKILVCTNDGRFWDEIVSVKDMQYVLKSSTRVPIEAVSEENGKLVAIWPA
ncbi:hypothetical protein ES706_02392 [subsurface metagenome]